ncbi:replication protein RepA [Flexibacterium corallicola]|uniref:replication protein RepA n=1 Tax=Flexibacterium corallicola TaxID=3037259 RepID=UPI00286EF34F|nr:replication protein RepA [Pseudovibrio sp. M1P-2-3]
MAKRANPVKDGKENIVQIAMKFGDDYAQKKATTPSEKKALDIKQQYEQSKIDVAQTLYSGFGLVSIFPHRQLKSIDQIWDRESAGLSIMIEPGYSREDGEPIQYGVPYGSRARLIMLYLQSKAIQNGPVIQLGTSMQQWMTQMGISTGGKSRAQVLEQANRIAACRISLSYIRDDGTEKIQRQNIVEEMSINTRLASSNPTAVLSESFYNTLINHRLKVEGRAIAALQNSSIAIDVYTWLCYRLHHITEDVPITWRGIYAQHGHGFKSLAQFKAKFKDDWLPKVLAVYQDARVEVDPRNGIILKPSPPALKTDKLYAVKAPAFQIPEKQAIETSKRQVSPPSLMGRR